MDFAMPPIPTRTDAARDDRVAARDPLLRIRGLKTHFETAEGLVKAVDGVDLEIPRGKTVCVVGESGCGKSMTARSILQLVERPGRIVDGTIEWRPDADSDEVVDVTGLSPKDPRLTSLRGGEIGMIFQEPLASLSPMYTIGAQLSEALRIHRGLSKAEARERAIDMLRVVGIPRPEQRIDAYPFQLSGGMCQRVMIAIALSCDPKLLIADEPTTALDVTTQARILDLLGDLQQASGMSMLFITHDMGVVAEIADEVVVMYLGRVAERGTVEQIFNDPKHPYTRALLQSIPTGGKTDGVRRPLTAIRGMIPHPQNRPTGCPFHNRCDFAVPGVCDVQLPPTALFDDHHLANCHLYDEQGDGVHPGAAVDGTVLGASSAPTPGEEPAAAGDDRTTPRAEVRERDAAPAEDGAHAAEAGAPLMRVRDLTKHFPLKKGPFSRSHGVVHAVDGVSFDVRPGETLGLVGESGCGKSTLGRTLARILDPTSGTIEYTGRDGRTVDMAGISGPELAQYRRDVRVIFQDPFSSLNPRMNLEQLVGEPLRNHKIAKGTELRDRVAEMLKTVGLRPEYLKRYPHAFSGGERQRINIARALITEPRLVIADEAVSALDVSVRAQILNLLDELQQEFDLTYLFISHDLSVVEHISDRVAVMYLGKIAERAETRDLYDTPQHPYTEALLHAVPLPDPALRGSHHGFAIRDELPDPANPPAGCPFSTRCPYVKEERCRDEVPVLLPVRNGTHRVACHYSDELELVGVQESR
ncbi:ABC transporter ATP-binding protein [Brachybacterium saurashtrense]|uniref:ABC transporter ATP-binding protein n=1 Tax=Brachybacterium saurashtrense TaxID=556288 RepID=A0A345YQT6_9MICO|nr:ABC transporter ATP-binding protein [Brachybacterium saurashtrense]AXK46288.1 ABC transporter ATP-binding protein [Brachybacterium saurashtrense]RRR24028.1 ABC transporter ATP-binding protein [Brachybacterium saurashtrense]